MTTATAFPATPSARAGTSRRVAALRAPELLRRPLASYYLLIGVTAVLLCLGMIMVLSASSVASYKTFGSSFAVFRKQLLWVAVGLPVFFGASRMPVRLWRWLGYPLLLGSLFLLLLVLVPHVGATVNGSTRWLAFGPVQVQPSESAKLALALWGADLLVRKDSYGLLDQPKHLMVPLLPVTLFIGVLVMMEPDLGTTLTVLLVLVALLWVAGTPGRYFGFLILGLGAAVSLLAVAEPYRLHRLTSFLHPAQHAKTTGYQALQGFYALSSGHLWGVGLGASREKWAYLPNANTDYIYAIIGEELGLLGTLVVVALYAVLAYVGVRIAHRAADDFSRLAALAVTAWLVGQAILNMGYVVGLLPVTGVPLPLISVGGTALVITLAAIGLLAAIARSEPGAAEALAARRGDRRGGRVHRWLNPTLAGPLDARSEVAAGGAARRRAPRRAVGRPRGAGPARSAPGAMPGSPPEATRRASARDGRTRDGRDRRRGAPRRSRP